VLPESHVGYHARKYYHPADLPAGRMKTWLFGLETPTGDYWRIAFGARGGLDRLYKLGASARALASAISRSSAASPVKAGADDDRPTHA
jgi:hypothetical protein